MKTDILKYKEFKKIDSDLKIKHKKVCKEIADNILWMDENFYKPFKSLSPEKLKSIRKHIEGFKLNDLHDTQNNLEVLISENYQKFVNWSCYLEPRKSSKVWLNKKRLECFEMDF
jgi:hypothetical protein